MTIRMRFNDGNDIKTYTYRNVYRGVNLAEYRASFFAEVDSARWGTLTQLKGKQIILLNSFGNVPEEYTV